MNIFTSGKSLLYALSFCALFGATAAQAENYSVRVNVPFQFMAGEKMYPAGDYNFTVDGNVHTLRIQSSGKLHLSMVRLAPILERRPGDTSEHGMVRFTKAGNLHVLNGVWRAGASDGNITYPSRAAREAARNAAAGQPTDIPAGNNPVFE